jgi:hypothetical protein
VLPLSAGEVRAIIEPALHEQSLELKAQVAELRRFVVASLDGLATRVAAETRELVQTLAPTPAPAPTRPLGWIVVAALGGLVAVATGAFAWQQQEALERLEARLVEESRAVDALRAELAVAAVAAAQARSTALPAATTMSLPAASADAAASRASLPAAAPAAAKSPAAALPSTRVYEVPYGEAPLAGGRVDALRSLFAGQDLRGFGGTVRIAAHVGDFCLVGTAAEGYAPAPADLPASRCDVTGNPFDDGLRPAQRQSVAFANWLAEMRALAGKRYAIVVAHDGRERPTVPYPDVADAAAGAWNAAARANHRVEVAFLPAQ